MIQNFAVKSKGGLTQDLTPEFAETFTKARKHPLRFIALRFQQAQRSAQRTIATAVPLIKLLRS